MMLAPQVDCKYLLCNRSSRAASPSSHVVALSSFCCLRSFVSMYVFLKIPSDLCYVESCTIFVVFNKRVNRSLGSMRSAVVGLLSACSGASWARVWGP